MKTNGKAMKVEIVKPVTVKEKGEYPSIDNKWRIEDDLRTLTQAAEIRRDKKRFADAKAMAKDKLAAIKSITGGE